MESPTEIYSVRPNSCSPTSVAVGNKNTSFVLQWTRRLPWIGSGYRTESVSPSIKWRSVVITWCIFAAILLGRSRIGSSFHLHGNLRAANESPTAGPNLEEQILLHHVTDLMEIPLPQRWKLQIRRWSSCHHTNICSIANRPNHLLPLAGSTANNATKIVQSASENSQNSERESVAVN